MPFPVHVVTDGNLRDDLLDGARGQRWASIPAFTRTITPAGAPIAVYGEDEDGEDVQIGERVLATDRVDVGMIRRQCTSEYKIVPIRRKVRELAGLTGRQSPDYPVVEQWIGISLDEGIRMKPSREAWQVNRWPLVERRMNRWDCLRWLQRHGYPIPPKSSCIGCPFHSDAMWRAIRDYDGAAWRDAITVDRAIRTGMRGMRSELFLHRSAVPPEQADLSTDADRGQQDLFANECEGLCGV